MYFRIAILGLLSSLVLTGCPGCHDSLNDKAPAAEGLNLSPGDSGCLSNVGSTVSEYVAGRASVDQITSAWSCAAKSLRLFADRTKGKHADYYRPEELRAFLHKYFLKSGSRISDSLLVEAMDLKRFVLGGETTKITRPEIDETLKLIGRLSDLSVKMHPFLPFNNDRCSQMASGAEQDACLAAFETTLLEVAREVAGIVGQRGESFDFGHLARLNQGFEGFLEPIIRQLPVIGFAKEFIMNTSRTQIDGHEWQELFSTVSRAYVLFLKFERLDLSHRNWSRGEGREQSLRWFGEVLGLLKFSATRRKDGVIPIAFVHELADRIGYEKFFNISKKTLERFLPVLFGKLLDDQWRGGVTLRSLDRIFEEATTLSEGQRYLEALYNSIEKSASHSGSGTLGYGPEVLLEPTIGDVLSVSFTQLDRVTQQSALRLRQIIRKEKPMFLGDDLEVTFGDDRRFSFGGLTQMNLLATITRFLMRAYAEDPKRRSNDEGITQPELVKFFWDFRDLGIDLKIMDRHDLMLPYKRFREGNLFTSLANGDDRISVYEGTQALALLSSAKRLANRTHSELDSICRRGAKAELDEYDYPKINAECYRREFFARVEHFWDRMPGMLRYYRSLRGADKETFEWYLEVVSRKGGHTAAAFNSSDSEGFAGVVQYIESIFARYDGDRSGTFSRDESEVAYRVFRNTLKTIFETMTASCHEEIETHALFGYLLAKGAPPQTKWEKFKYWYWLKTDPAFESDRMKLLKIFSMLGQGSSGKTDSSSPILCPE